MNQIKEYDGLIGKTITRTACLENQLFFFFADDTFCISRGCGWDSNDVELSDEDFNIEPNDYNLSDLKEIGLLDEEKFNQLRLEKENREKERRKNIDLEKLKELKEKYPNG